MAALLIMLSVIMHYVCESKKRKEMWIQRTPASEKGRDGKTVRPKCCFEEERPNSLVKTTKSLFGRWEYNCHQQASRVVFKEQGYRSAYKQHTSLKDPVRHYNELSY